MAIKKLRKLKISMFLVPLFIMLIFSIIVKVKAAGPSITYSSVNDIFTYCLNTDSSTYPSEYYFMGIEDSMCATSNESIYVKRVFDDCYGTCPSANIRFMFEWQYNTLQREPVYKIVSPLDLEGCITVCGGNIKDNTQICFAKKDSSKQKYQNWLVRELNDGTYQFVLEKYKDYALTYDGNNCFLYTAKNAYNSYFELKKVLNADYEIKTNLTKCTNGYDYDINNSTTRILSPLSVGTGKISKMYSVGINANKNTYNGVDAYYINPTKKQELEIKINRTYSNYQYDNDKRYGMDLNNVYSLNNDTSILSGTNNKRVGDGIFIIETSDNNVNFTRSLFYSYYSNGEDIITLDSSILSSGKYIRISYLFQLAYSNKRINICETSDSFFACYDGLGEDDFGVARVKYNDSIVDYNNEYSEIIKKSSTLKDGGLVIDGFCIEEIVGGYKIEVKHNDDNYVNYSNGSWLNEPGKYEIKITSKFCGFRSITIYNLGRKDDFQNISSLIEKIYFENYYKDSYETSNSLISGNRLLSGDNSFLNSIGINLPYSWINLPVFVKGCNYRINKLAYYPSLSGKIERVDNSGNETSGFDSAYGDIDGLLDKTGYYTITLTTNNSTGLSLKIVLNFMLVDEEVGPVINELMINNISQEIYDLKPVYYGVDVECGSYKYFDGENEIEKQGILTYAFSTYKSALDFALKIEKKYAIKNENGYKYAHCDYVWEIDEYDLYKLMIENAKNNVKKCFFSKDNEIVNNSISVSIKGYSDMYENNNVEDAYQVSFEGNNNRLIVTNSLEERKFLTDRQPFINNYEFVNFDLDSYIVKMINEDTKEEYNIKYNLVVDSQLEELQASSGKYKVVEENIHGVKNEYYVYYIAKNDNSFINANVIIDNVEITINKDYNSKIVASTFEIRNINCKYDDHCLIYIRHENEYEAYDSFDFISKTIDKKGTYEIKILDRLGNKILINLEIE